MPDTPEKELIVEDEAAPEVVVAIDPLDHDADGKKGGSKTGAASTRSRGAAKQKAIGLPDGEEKVWIVLEESEDIPPTGLPLAHNGIACIVKPGEPVAVPQKYLNILDDAVMSKPLLESGTGRVIGHRDRMRFPYRRVAAPADVE